MLTWGVCCSLKLCLGVLERIAIVQLNPKLADGKHKDPILFQAVAPPEYITAVCWACFLKPHAKG